MNPHNALDVCECSRLDSRRRSALNKINSFISTRTTIYGRGENQSGQSNKYTVWKKETTFRGTLCQFFVLFIALWTLPCGPIQTMQRNTRRARSSRRALNYISLCYMRRAVKLLQQILTWHNALLGLCVWWADDDAVILSKSRLKCAGALTFALIGLPDALCLLILCCVKNACFYIRNHII